jgi:hypothetical protein
VYVSEALGHRVQEFDIFGAYTRLVGSQGSGDGQFNYPDGLAADIGRNLYVSDSGNNRAQKFSEPGNFLTKWGTTGTADGQFRHPEGIAVTPAGRVYVVDNQNFRVDVFQTSVVSVPLPKPSRSRLALYPIVPSPVRLRADIDFDLPVAGRVALGFYDLRGRLLRKAIAHEYMTAGRHRWHWDGREDSGVRLSTGIYILVLQTDSETATRKAVVLE